MPLKNYNLLVGYPKGYKLDDDASPHIEILLHAKQESHRIAVNVRSKQHPHDLLYLKDENYGGERVKGLLEMSEGLTNMIGSPLAIDYVQDNEFTKSDMKIVPYERQGPNNDLKDLLIPLINEAIHCGNTKIYAFGETWGPDSGKDKYFGFTPKRGIHDIHMNQGSTGRFSRSNGSKQDGALFFQNSDGRWTAIFLAFQSQLWNGQEPHEPHEPNEPVRKDSSVQIIAALVNAINPEEGKETVTLLNRSDKSVNISNWKIRDKDNRDENIGHRIIDPGDTFRFNMSGNNARLGNSGGKIILLDNENTIVDQVTYSRSTRPEGWSHVFLSN